MCLENLFKISIDRLIDFNDKPIASSPRKIIYTFKKSWELAFVYFVNEYRHNGINSTWATTVYPIHKMHSANLVGENHLARVECGTDSLTIYSYDDNIRPSYIVILGGY